MGGAYSIGSAKNARRIGVVATDVEHLLTSMAVARAPSQLHHNASITGVPMVEMFGRQLGPTGIPISHIAAKDLERVRHAARAVILAVR